MKARLERLAFELEVFGTFGEFVPERGDELLLLVNDRPERRDAERELLAEFSVAVRLLIRVLQLFTEKG